MIDYELECPAAREASDSTRPNLFARACAAPDLQAPLYFRGRTPRSIDE